MGKLSQGIFGGFVNKVGNVIGSSWKGISTVRIMPTSVANPRTAGQIAQRSAFSTCTAFASVILASICVPLWNRFAMKMSGFNAFVQRNIANFNANGVITSSQLVIAEGKLEINVLAGVVIDSGDKTISFETAAVVNPRYGQASDKCYYLLMDNATSTVLGAGDTGKTRSDVEAGTVINVDYDITVGQFYDLYICYLRADGTMTSNTSHIQVQSVA